MSIVIYKKNRLLISIVALVFFHMIPCVCALSRTSTSATSVNGPWNWTKESWIGDNRPYHQARIDISRLLSQGQKPANLMRKYKLLAQKSRKPLDKFRWAYITYQTAIKGSSFADKELIHVMKSLSNVASPKTYEYTRLRFLIEARMWPFRQLKNVGKRLAKRNPKDYEVKYYLVKIFDPGRYPGERQEALHYSQDLIRLAPKRLRAYPNRARFQEMRAQAKCSNAR